MKIIALQLDIEPGNRRANMEKIATLTARHAKKFPDVLVLPEIWDVGFYPENVLELADECGKEAKAFLSELAVRHNVNIVGGSIARRENGKIWNTAYVFNRAGELQVQYDKAHLFSFAGEDLVFQPGENLGLFTLDGITAGLIICYDLRFPELTRSLALKGAEIIFAPAAWPHPRLEHWRILAKARAVENQLYFVAVNGCGKLGKLDFCGHSAIISPLGEILSEADEKEQSVEAVFDIAAVREIRGQIKVFKDRRPSLYEEK